MMTGFGSIRWVFVGAGVGLEIIDRQIDRLVVFELLDVLDQQRGIERVGVVEVDLHALVGG